MFDHKTLCVFSPLLFSVHRIMCLASIFILHNIYFIDCCLIKCHITNFKKKSEITMI